MVKLGKYELLQPLASGGMADLFLARQSGVQGFEKTVVVKRLHARLAGDQTLVNMFIDEARIAARLNHTNIVQIYDLGADEGSYFIAMEYVPGRDLRQIQAREAELGQHLSHGMAAYIVSRMCRGLFHAHSFKDGAGQPLQIVHRDISPQNVLLSFDGEVKLADFGIAKAVSRVAQTQAGVLRGKVAYMSPEQVEHRPVDGRSDVFAAGILLYELTCRRRLFRRNSDFATMRAVLKDPIPPPSVVSEDVPDEIEAVIMRALARDPDQRYPDAQQMQLELEQAVRANGWSVGAREAADLMEALFGDPAVPVMESISPDEVTADAVRDTAPRLQAIPETYAPPDTKDSGAVRAFINAATVMEDEEGRPAFGGAPGRDELGRPDRAGSRPKPSDRFPEYVEEATMLGAPSFEDVVEEEVTSPDITAQEHERDDETEVVPMQPPMPMPMPPPPAAPSPASPGAPLPASPVSFTPPHPLAQPVTNRPVTNRPPPPELRPTPTIAATPAPPPRRGVPRVVWLVATLLVLGGGLTYLGVALWNRGVIGPRRFAVVQVSSEPTGAVVYLDGERRFGLTPLSMHGISMEAAHKLVVALDGHEPWRLELKLGRKELRKSIVARLRQVRLGGAPGTLVVEVNQVGAQVFLDGELKGIAPLTIERVTSGKAHVLVVKQDGFDESVMRIDMIKPGEKRMVHVTLRPGHTEKLERGVERPRGKGLPSGHVVLPGRASVPPLREGDVGQRLPDNLR